MNEVGHEKGSSFLASISRKINHDARSAMRSIFSGSVLIKASPFRVTRNIAPVMHHHCCLAKEFLEQASKPESDWK